MSESDILALIRGNATIPYRIYIDGNSTPLTEYEIVSTSYEDYRYVDTDSLVIGQFVARTLNGEIKNINRDLLIENKEIEVQMGVKVGDTTTWYSLGNFLITKPEEDDVKDKMTFKSMDYTKKFNKTFDSSLITFPCTAVELAQGVCSQCGVELGTTNFTNADFVIENSQYDSGDSCRKVMQDIGKLAYSWVRIGWDNKCYIDFEVQTEVEDYNIITNDNYYDFKKQQKQFGPVNRVVIGLKNVDGENVAVQDDDSIEQNGLHTLYIYDNNLTYTPELRQQAIAGATRLFGLKYTPIETNTTGHPWLKGDEVVRIIDMDGSIVESYPFDRTVEYMGHIKSKLVSKADTQTQLEYVNNNTLGQLLNRTKIVVDKQNQKIQAVVESVSSTETKVRDLENSVDYFSVDLSQYTLTIPTNSMQKPLETRNYDINYYGYYKGKQVVPNVSVSGNNDGITTSTTSTYIRFAVDVNSIISNLTNNYTITFTYDSPSGAYTLIKKVSITLSIQGKDGTSVNILGSYNSLEELKQAHPTGNIGDAYIVQGDMYVWSTEDNDWVDVGNIQGPAGTNGKDGEDGKSAYQIWLEKGNVGSEQDYLDSLKGQDGQNGQDGKDGKDGINGTNGKDGTSTYFYVRYSANSNGNPMTQAPTTTTKYMGVASTTSPTAPTSYSAYTWSLIKGEDGKDGQDGKDGEQGIQGPKGEDGTSSYLHIKYSDDGKTFTANNGETVGRYRGELVDNNLNDSLVFSDYTWYDMSLIVDEELEEIRQDVKENTALIEETDEQIRLDVAENYTSKGTFDEFKKTTETELKVQSDSLVISISSIEERMNVLGTNIDGTTGDVTSVKTGKGFTFNDDGLNISDPNEDFNTLITNRATQYKNGDEVITETSKDGFMTTDLKEKGTHRYSWNGSDYDMVAERIEIDGEYAYAHFYNGGDY